MPTHTTASGKIISHGTLGYHIAKLLEVQHPDIWSELSQQVLGGYKASPRGSSASRRVLAEKLATYEKAQAMGVAMEPVKHALLDGPAEDDDAEDIADVPAEADTDVSTLVDMPDVEDDDESTNTDLFAAGEEV